jgi:TetR/AcrR family transcriptional regulator
MMSAASIPECAPGAQAILEAGEELFADKGFAAVSMAEIARVAGVSKANIYHHYASKEDLYLDILERATAGTTALLDKAEQVQGPITSRIESFLVAYAQKLKTNPRTHLLLLREMSEFGSVHGREIAGKAIHGNFERIVDLVRAARDAGELRSDINARIVASTFAITNLNFVLYRTVFDEFIGELDGDAAETYCRTVVRSMLDGIRPEKSTT